MCYSLEAVRDAVFGEILKSDFMANSDIKFKLN